MLSVKLIMYLKNMIWSDIAPEKVSIDTLYRAMKGVNITDNTLGKLGEALGIGGSIHFLYALDRLAVIAGKPVIDVDGFLFPESIPAEIQIAMAERHPVFIRHVNSEHIKKSHENQGKTNTAA